MDQITSELIDSLKQLPALQDPYLSKRAEHRYNLRTRTHLDLQRSDGETMLVSALDVSNSGIGFLCRRILEVDERIGLRLAFQHEGGFDFFIVRRGTGTLGGYKIGAVVC